MIVVEEQIPGGGLGSQVALFLKERAMQSPFCHLSLPEEYPSICGDRAYLLDHSKLSKAHIKRKIKQFLHTVRERMNA